MNGIPLDHRIVHPLVYPLARCPGCGSAQLAAVVETVVEEVHFLCRDCDACWNVTMGFVQRVSPSACLGCPERERAGADVGSAPALPRRTRSTSS